MGLAKNSFIKTKKGIVTISFCCLGLAGCVNDDISDLNQYIRV